MNIDYRKIASSIEREMCSEHHERPKVEINGNQVTIKACCEKFRTKMAEKFHGEFAKATQEAIMKAFKR